MWMSCWNPCIDAAAFSRTRLQLSLFFRSTGSSEAGMGWVGSETSFPIPSWDPGLNFLFIMKIRVTLSAIYFLLLMISDNLSHSC